MATLLHLLGEGTYVELLKAVGGYPEPSHTYARCPHRSRCTEHRRLYRRLLRARNARKTTVFTMPERTQALWMLAHQPTRRPLSEMVLQDLARVARIDPNPTRLATVSVAAALESVARRTFYLAGKG